MAKRKSAERPSAGLEPRTRRAKGKRRARSPSLQPASLPPSLLLSGSELSELSDNAAATTENDDEEIMQVSPCRGPSPSPPPSFEPGEVLVPETAPANNPIAVNAELATRVAALEASNVELQRALAHQGAMAESMRASIVWLDEMVRRLDPTGTQLNLASRPALAAPSGSRKRGGGPKLHKDLQRPFLAEVRKRMGLGLQDPLPAYEAEPPTLSGAPVLRLDWDRGPQTYLGLVGGIIEELSRIQPTAREQVQALGGHGAAVQVCMDSLERLFGRYRDQQHAAADPASAEVRKASRRRASRAQRKSKRRSDALAREPKLQRQYGAADFAVREAMSAEETEAEDHGEGGPAALAKVVPVWQSLELIEAFEALDSRHEQRLAAQPTPPAQLRPRAHMLPVHWPAADAVLEPLSGSIQRWMVHAEFARRFPHLIANVSLNDVDPAGEGASSCVVRSPEQWGQRPPYPILEPVASHSLDDGLFCFDHGEDGGNSDGNDIIDPALRKEGQAPWQVSSAAGSRRRRS